MALFEIYLNLTGRALLIWQAFKYKIFYLINFKQINWYFSPQSASFNPYQQNQFAQQNTLYMQGGVRVSKF